MGLSPAARQISLQGEHADWLMQLADEFQWQRNDADAAIQLQRELGRLAVSIKADKALSKFKPTAFQLNTIDVQSTRGADVKQPLIRACGLHKKPNQRILDVCAGTGSDAYILAHFADAVVSCERHPVIYALLRDAIVLDGAHLPWDLQHADACVYVQNLDQQFDCAYVDPMFDGDKKRRAAERKEMQILRYLENDLLAEAGGVDDNDAKQLIEAIAATNINRVVIKRPLKSERIVYPGRRLMNCITGKGFRLDIYLLG